MDWNPTISEATGPIYLRIVEALSSDIASGRLVRGQQLPTHRALAKSLDVDLTTVTRAYGEARRRGLLDAHVGQGTFVSETSARAASDMPYQVKIDLSMNVPPHPVEANLDVRITHGLAAIRNQTGLTAFLNYQPPGGSDEERAAAADWLRRRVPQASADRLIVYPGSQAILFNVLLSLTSPGDVVLTEQLTFPGIKAAAAKLGVRLVGVEMDAEGIQPDALKNACRLHQPKAVYLIPTLHNPTTATLSPARRKAIAAIIRASGAFLIEDDAYGWLDPTASPIANLIPERSYLGGKPVEMHRTGAARRLPAGAGCSVGTNLAQQSAGNDADAAAVDGGFGNALAQVGDRRPDCYRHSQRVHRPPTTCVEDPEGTVVRGCARRTPPLAYFAASVELQRFCFACVARGVGRRRRGCIRGECRCSAFRAGFVGSRAQSCRTRTGAARPCQCTEVAGSECADRLMWWHDRVLEEPAAEANLSFPMP